MLFIFTFRIIIYYNKSGDYMKKEDFRISKTKASLYRTLKELMKDNNFEDIKISDICNKSNINRSTFYDHYKDKNKLLNSIINDKEQELRESINSNELPEIIKVLLNDIENNYDLYKSIIKITGNSMIQDMMIKLIYESTPYKDKYQNIFYASGIVNTIIYYLDDKETFDKKELLRIINKIIKK